MDKTKKTQRSYSSFRAKTQQAEIVDDNENSWIASQNGQKILKHLNHKISTSQLVNPNDGLFQSVSQRIPQPKNAGHYNSCIDAQIENMSECGFDGKSFSSSHQATDISKMQKVISHLRQKCKNYEKALQFFNRQRQQSLKYSAQNKQNIKHSNNFNNSNNFNYSEQYYVKEVEDLRRQVLMKDGELEKYRQLYTNKSTEVEGISKEISQRIEKQNDEKMLYIKELNMRNIQLKKLTDRLELFTSQLKTKEFVIKQKDDKIEDLTRQLQGFGHKKLKIEGYQQKIHQNQQRLKEIEQYTLRLKQEIDKKDLMYKQKSEQVNNMEKSFEEYEQKLKMIEVSYVQELQKKTKLQQAFDQMKEQYEKMKQDFIKMASLKQLIKEKEQEIRKLVSSLEEMKQEINKLTEDNEIMRQDIGVKNNYKEKVEIYQHEINNLKRLLRERDETISSQQASLAEFTELQQKYALTQQNLSSLTQTLEQKQKAISSLQLQSLTFQSHIQQLTTQFQSLEQQLQKAREKQSKIDEFYKENQKLNQNIHQRLNEIEKLQQRIATLQTKLTNLAHENSKIKTAKDELTQELAKAQVALENMGQQLMRETLIKRELQQMLEQHSEELTKREHQCTAFKATINQLEDENVRLCNELDDMVEKHAQETEEMQQQLQSYHEQKQKSQEMMKEASRKILLLNDTVIECKNNLNELGRKEIAHREMVKALEGEIKRIEEQRNRLFDEKGRLNKAMEKIYSISFEAKGI